MRLIHAITASDFQNSGHNYPGQGTTWTRIGKLPIWMYSAVGNTNSAQPGGVRFRGDGAYFMLPIGRGLRLLKEGEVMTCGQYLAPFTGALANNGVTFLRAFSNVGEENLFTWADVYPFTARGTATFIEYSCSYDLKTWSLYVNGKFVKSVTAGMNHDRDSLAFYYHAQSGISTINLEMKDVYVAIFDPAVEKPYLGRWTCDALIAGVSDFPNSAAADGTTDNLSETPKSIVYTYAGTRKFEAVALGGTMSSPMAEQLEVTMVSGDITQQTVSTTPLPNEAEVKNAIGPGTAIGIGSGGYDPVSKKVTATLKLRP